MDAASGATQWTTVFRSLGRTLKGGKGYDASMQLTPCAQDGRVYVATFAGRLLCLDLVTGRPIWEHPVANPFHGRNKAPVVADGVVAWAGDGGTADIGIQALSGAIERGEDFLYICYDNEAYMNTGVQRSGTTPRGTVTANTAIHGKRQHSKDLPSIIAAHSPAYVASCSAEPASTRIACSPTTVSGVAGE